MQGLQHAHSFRVHCIVSLNDAQSNALQHFLYAAFMHNYVYDFKLHFNVLLFSCWHVRLTHSMSLLSSNYQNKIIMTLD